MSALQLRRAAITDAAAIASLMQDEEVFGQTLQLPYATEDAWRKRLDGAAAGAVDLHLVAVRGGDVVGSAGLHTVSKSVRRSHAVTLGISIGRPWQGQGIGTALIKALLEYADGWTPLVRIELTVWSDNQRAIALYSRHGFDSEGTLRAYGIRAGRYVDAVYMARLRPQALRA